jgi:hypothetical protein
MSLANGDSAASWDTWIRIVTNKKYLKADGTVTSNAFGGNAIARPREPRPWSIEFSGGLLSMVADLHAYGGRFGPEKFVGYLFQEVPTLRNEDRRTDVVYTPNDDTAHADVVSFRPFSPEERFALRDWLQDCIQCVRADNLEALQALRRDRQD